MSEFIRTHIGWFTTVEGGFQLSMSWGMLIGISVTVAVVTGLKKIGSK